MAYHVIFAERWPSWWHYKVLVQMWSCIFYPFHCFQFRMGELVKIRAGKIYIKLRYVLVVWQTSETDPERAVLWHKKWKTKTELQIPQIHPIISWYRTSTKHLQNFHITYRGWVSVCLAPHQYSLVGVPPRSSPSLSHPRKWYHSRN